MLTLPTRVGTPMLSRNVAVLVAFASVVTGCAEFQAQFENRYGPSPVPIAAFVDASTARQVDVVMAMARGALPPGQLPVTDEEWYRVILAGFNVVDDACISYIDDLWILERRRTRNGALIAAVGSATSGIVAANANPSAITLAILAQAFGLASALNTAISDSYLYSQNAATIKKLVRGTTEAYRVDLAANFKSSEIKYPIASVPAAYHHMREYLALCLPPTIQAQIEDLVTNAKSGPVGSDSNKNPPASPSRSTPSTLAAPPPASSGSRSINRTSPAIRVF
jgi:hypothetical protein